MAAHSNKTTSSRELGHLSSQFRECVLVTMADRDRWEKLISPERLRVGQALKGFGVSALSKLPALPSITKPQGAA